MRPTSVRLRALATASLLCVTATVGAATDSGVAHAANVSTFQGLFPSRVLETRAGLQTFDGLFNGVGALVTQGTTSFKVVERGLLLSITAVDVAAVVLNVTVTNPTAPGFLTVYPSNVDRPTSSNLNFVRGQTIANLVIVPVGPDGSATIFNGSAGTSDVAVDLLGWFPSGPGYKGLTPARVLETRPSLTTVDGQFSGTGKLNARATSNLTLVGRGGIPSTGVGAIVVNVTATNPTAAGFLTVFPAGQNRPTASNVNFVKGETIPNMVIVPVGAGGQVSIFNGSSGTTDVVVDVLGWFPTGSSFTGLNPARLLDTRSGYSTVDGRFSGGGTIPTSPTTFLNLTVTGRGGVPTTDVGAVALNITVTNPTGPGYVAVFPQGGFSASSSVNFVAGQTVPNMVIVPVGGHGQISIQANFASSDIIVDVLGWFPNPTIPPTNFGNDLVLKATGIGSVPFGATPESTIALMASRNGGPDFEQTEFFSGMLPGSDAFYSVRTGHTFKHRWGRLSCFRLGPCITFGGDSPTTMTFVGWTYKDSLAILIDDNGLSIGSRGSDFPGGIATINSGSIAGCRVEGSGVAANGIRLGLISIGQPFVTYNDAGTPTYFTPGQGDVRVAEMSSGDSIYADGGCPYDFFL